MAAKAWKEIRDLILSHGAAEAKKVDPRRVRTARWVRLKCQYGCDGYGSCLTCPPYAPSPEQTREVLDSYSVAFLIHWGQESGGRKVMAEIERRVFLMGFHKAFALAGGPCELCDECNMEGGCRHAYQARPSMEACGIDVFGTARDARLPIHVMTCHEDQPNFYSLLLVE